MNGFPPPRVQQVSHAVNTDNEMRQTIQEGKSRMMEQGKDERASDYTKLKTLVHAGNGRQTVDAHGGHSEQHINDDLRPITVTSDRMMLTDGTITPAQNGLINSIPTASPNNGVAKQTCLNYELTVPTMGAVNSLTDLKGLFIDNDVDCDREGTFTQLQSLNSGAGTKQEYRNI